MLKKKTMTSDIEILQTELTNFKDSVKRNPSIKIYEITYGSNNYPSNLGDYALIGFDDFKQLLEFIDKYGGEAYHFQIRDGWHFYEKMRYADKPYNANDYINTIGDLAMEAYFDFDTISERLHDLANDFSGDGDFGPIELFIDEQKKIQEAIDSAGDYETVIINDCSIETIDNEMLSFKHDVWTYHIGVLIDRDYKFKR